MTDIALKTIDERIQKNHIVPFFEEMLSEVRPEESRSLLI